MADAPETSVLVDEFDTMIEADGPTPGFAIGELDPTSHSHDVDMADTPTVPEDDIFGRLDDLVPDDGALTTQAELPDEPLMPEVEAEIPDDSDVFAPELDERLTTSLDDLVPVGASGDDMFEDHAFDDDLATDDVDDAEDPNDPFGTP